MRKKGEGRGGWEREREEKRGGEEGKGKKEKRKKDTPNQLPKVFSPPLQER